MHRFRFWLAGLATALIIPIAAAAIPPLLNYQGVLRDAAGDIVPDGNYSVTFRIWDAETNGVALWQEGRLLAVQDGLFTVLLGSIVPIPDTLFSRPDRWIGVQVGLDSEMSPRQQLVSVPFAWHSLKADKSDTASVAQMVDTSGYSAFDDLVGEGRIGNQSGQLAEGDHSHQNTNLHTFEDGTFASASIIQSQGYVAIKSLTLPMAAVPTYMRIVALCNRESNGANVEWQIRLNGQLIYSGGSTLEGYPILGVTMMYGEECACWCPRPDYIPIVVPYSLVAGSLVTPLEMEISAFNGGNGVVIAKVYRVFVEYVTE